MGQGNTHIDLRCTMTLLLSPYVSPTLCLESRLYILFAITVCVEEQGFCSLVPRLSPCTNEQAMESWVGPGNEAKVSVVCSVKLGGKGIRRPLPKSQTVVASFSIPLFPFPRKYFRGKERRGLSSIAIHLGESLSTRELC